MKILDNAPLLAGIWVAAMVIPLAIRGYIANYTLAYYEQILFIYGFIIVVSTIGTLMSSSRNKKEMRTSLNPKELTPHNLLVGWLFSNALLTIGLWILGFATGTV